MPYKKSLEKIAYIIILIMFFIFPTSINRTPHSAVVILLLSLLQCSLILFFALQEWLNRWQLFFAIVTILYMGIATMIALTDPALYLNLPRMEILICFIGLCCITNKSRMSADFFIHILDFVCVVIVIWNFIKLIRIQPFISFVNYFYTQLDTYTATYWSLVRNKPIFTFGVHNFASIFYLHFFLFNYFAFQKFMKKRFLFYMVMLFGFTLLLRATSSAGIAGIMLLLFLKLFWKDKRKIIIIFLCLAVGMMLFFASGLASQYMSAFSSKANGFLARYSNETSIYEGNYSMLESFPMGIGFTVGHPQLNLYFADSGYIIYYTMGGIFLPCMLFLLLYRYYKKNLNKKMALILTGVAMLTELSLISFMYEKTLYLYIFEVGFYRSILGCGDYFGSEEIVGNAKLAEK